MSASLQSSKIALSKIALSKVALSGSTDWIRPDGLLVLSLEPSVPAMTSSAWRRKNAPFTSFLFVDFVITTTLGGCSIRNAIGRESSAGIESLLSCNSIQPVTH